MTMRSRGQALIETAIALPVFLIAMFGAIWALQSGVLGERVQSTVRYGGLVSARQDPYAQYSLLGAYNAAAGIQAPAPCATAPPDMLSDAGPIATPAKASAPFWQPSSGSATSSSVCGRTISNAAGLSRPQLLTRANMRVGGKTDVPAFLQPVLGATSSSTATVNELGSPDMAAVVGCYPEVQSAFEATATAASGGGALPAVAPIAQPDATALALAGNCGG